MHDEENLNWHQKAGYHGMHPLGAYAGGYDDDPALSNPMSSDFQFGQAVAPSLADAGSTAGRVASVLPQAVKGAILDPLARDIEASVPYPGRATADVAAPLYRAIGRASKFSAPGRGLPGMFMNEPGGYSVANSMGPMRGRFADLSGIHQQTHGATAYGGGYNASSEGRRPVVVHEVHRTYSTDAPIGRLFEPASGVSEATVNRLRDALMGVVEGR
jgi:hypothetical protein